MIKVDIYYEQELLNTLIFNNQKDYLRWYPFNTLENNPCLSLVTEMTTPPHQEESKLK